MTSKIAIVIQCRDRSTRYPAKSVRPFHKEKSILEILINRFKYLDYPIIVATSRLSPTTFEIAKRCNVEVRMGSENDVLSRFVDIVDEFELDGVIRVCADNPFIQLPLMYPIIAWKRDHDYVAYFNAMGRHEGFWVEYVSAEALRIANKCMLHGREHVTQYIYWHPEMFSIKWLDVPSDLDFFHLRLTVDTERDFAIARKVYKYAGRQHWYYILNWIKEHPEVYQAMQENIKRNMK